MKKILTLVFLIFLPISGWTQRLPLETSLYDKEFKQYSEQYMPGRDWRLLKAQCYQESLFDADARSHVGAMGLCQFMPGTWNETASLLRKNGDPYDPELSIMFSAHYMSRQRRFFRSLPMVDMESLSIASYNAGAGNILKAQKKCVSSEWKNVLFNCLPVITGKHAKETQTYVVRIWSFFDRLKKMS